MNKSQFHPVTKFLHWTIVILVLAQFINISLVPEGRSVSPDIFLNMHMSFGVLVVPFALALLFMRYFRSAPKSAEQISALQQKALLVMEFLLYTLLFLIPVAGLAAVNSRGLTVNLFNLVNLPDLFMQGSSFAHTLGRMHSGLAWLVAFLVTGHTGMALIHHFVVKDDALKRMLPNFLVK